MESTSVRAIVATQHHNDGAPMGTAPNYSLEDLKFSPPKLGPNEYLVRMVASGICHTDIVMALFSGDTQWVPGHEGAGVVVVAGSATSRAKKGDLVLMSTMSCTECEQCLRNQPSNCPRFFELNQSLVARPQVYEIASTSKPVNGTYFGQSSWASHAKVLETSIQNVTHLIKDEEELKMLAPLGCGIQTGAGAVVNLTEPGPQTDLLIMGLGGVGLAAIMAAKITGCRHIIALDRVQSRLTLAKELGATDTINTTDVPLDEVAEKVRSITKTTGVLAAIDTTGNEKVTLAGAQALMTGGQIILIGVPMPGVKPPLTVMDLVQNAITLRGNLMGNSDPKTFVPQAIKWWREGKLPLEKLVKFYKVEDFAKAIEEMEGGHTIKPVLLW